MSRFSKFIFLSALLTCGCAGFQQQTAYTWTCHLGLPIECIELQSSSNGRTIFAGSSEKRSVFRSDDFGKSWDTIPLPVPSSMRITVRQLLSHPHDSSVLFVVCGNAGILRSSNGGRKWRQVLGEGDILGEALSYSVANDALYYGEFWRGPTWKSTDRGLSWDKVGVASKFVGLCTTVASATNPVYLLAGSNGGAVAKSTDEGVSWKIVLENEYDRSNHLGPEVPKILADPDDPKHYWVARWLAKTTSFAETTDDGNTWRYLNSPSKKIWYLEVERSTPKQTHRRIWAGLFNVHRTEETRRVLNVSSDEGETWVNCEFPETHQIWMIKHSVNGMLFVASDSGLFVAQC